MPSLLEYRGPDQHHGEPAEANHDGGTEHEESKRLGIFANSPTRWDRYSHTVTMPPLQGWARGGTDYASIDHDRPSHDRLRRGSSQALTVRIKRKANLSRVVYGLNRRSTEQGHLLIQHLDAFGQRESTKVHECRDHASRDLQ